MPYSKQKGFLPTVLFLTGVLIHLVFIGGTLPYLLLGMWAISSDGFTPLMLKSFVEMIAEMVGLVWSIPLVFGSFFVAAFPKIRTTSDGIETCAYLVFRSRIKWTEIDSIVSLPKGYKAIAIARPGHSLVNGLYSNKIYGDMIKSRLPVILISPHLENVDLLLQEINNHMKRQPSRA
jgi:hypothetical protein